MSNNDKSQSRSCSKEGTATDPEKIAAVESWPQPITLSEVSLAYVNTTGISSPDLLILLVLCTNLWKKVSHSNGFLKQRKHSSIWKEALIKASVLGYYPCSNGKYLLDTDTNNQVIGAVLSQRQDDEENHWPITAKLWANRRDSAVSLSLNC